MVDIGCQDRIETDFWDPVTQWQFLATDLWSLGRLHAALGERAEAQAFLERALDIWRTYGHNLPHVQADALDSLNAEIARLAL